MNTIDRLLAALAEAFKQYEECDPADADLYFWEWIKAREAYEAELQRERKEA